MSTTVMLPKNFKAILQLWLLIHTPLVLW